MTTTENSKEVLHTQGERKYFLAEHKGLQFMAYDSNEYGFGKIVCSFQKDVVKANAELIVKAVNERQKLLDSNRELLEILEKISQWRKLKSDVFTYANGDGNNFDNQIKSAINNAKNI